MRFAVVSTCTDENARKASAFTWPLMQAFAERNGFEWIGVDGLGADHNRYKMELIRRTLSEVDRVLYLEPHCIVRHDCPDPFKLVPENLIAMFDESELRAQSNDVRGQPRHYNGDVIVASKSDIEFFNLDAASEGHKFFQLPIKFNRLPFSVAMTGEYLADSYIVNLGAALDTDDPVGPIRKIVDKFNQFEVDGVPDYRKQINIHAPEPLGDCVAMEPVVRYIANVMHPEARITVKTKFPEIFEHLALAKGPNMFRTIGEDDEFGFGFNIDLLRQRGFASFNLMHPMDYGSLAAFGGHVPGPHREIKLACSLPKQEYVKDHILIHPGATWQSRTFPTWYWQTIIDGLIACDLKVAIIGKNYAGDTRGIVKVLDTSRCLDLVDKLSLKELIAVIRDSAMLISNDSSPIHISGAFQNPTILINSCKHHDFIWPQRSEGLNLTLGGPLKAATPSVGLVNSTRLDVCDEDELRSVLPPTTAVVVNALEVLRQRGE